GPGGPTVTENDGRVFITLKPINQRVGVNQVIARLNKALQPVWGITLYMQAAQDITVGARISKTQYQYTLVDVDIDELDHWAPILFNKLKTLPQLSDFAKIVSTVAPIAVNHQGQFPSVTLSFNLPPNVSIGAAVTAIQQGTKELNLPASIATSFQGSAQAFQNSLSSTPILILAALI